MRTPYLSCSVCVRFTYAAYSLIFCGDFPKKRTCKRNGCSGREEAPLCGHTTFSASPELFTLAAAVPENARTGAPSLSISSTPRYASSLRPAALSDKDAPPRGGLIGEVMNEPSPGQRVAR